jgi:glycerol dehydrogenase
VSRLRVAPGELLRGEDAIALLGARLRALGAKRVTIVHGAVGFARVEGRLATALAAGPTPSHHAHVGPCSAAAIDAAAASARAAGADWILAVGGGRVIDTGKGAATELGVPCAALPTSPATCAATAPTVVVYDERGRHREAREAGPSVALTALDPTLLASAPDRLLRAGIADAWAKVHEVRLTAAGAQPLAATTRAAVALLHDLAELLATHGAEAVAGGASRALVAEAVVVMPGLIGGLAGRDAKLALAHPIHDALTALPGSIAALHGEKVAFGSLVQLYLAGPDGIAWRGRVRDEEAFAQEALRYRRIGLDASLSALGCAEAATLAGSVDVARRALEDPAVDQALPGLDAATLAEAIRAVDAALSRG